MEQYIKEAINITDTKNEAKTLRATTINIAKLEDRKLYVEKYKNKLIDIAPKIIPHFGCTNIIFANCVFG